MTKLLLIKHLSLIVIVVAVVAGCGGGSSDASGRAPYKVKADTTMTVASPPLGKPVFVARANRICREAWVTIVDNFSKYTGWHEGELSERDLFAKATQVTLLASIDFHIFDSVHFLGTPMGQEHAVEAIIGPLQYAVETGQQQLWRAYSVAEVPPHFDRFNQRARRYGLDDCLVDRRHLRPIEA